MPEAADVPVVVPVEGVERIRKAVNLAQREFVFEPGAENDAAAGGAEVDGGDVERGGGHRQRNGEGENGTVPMKSVTIYQNLSEVFNWVAPVRAFFTVPTSLLC
jgi:hypothetical protein